VPQKKKERRHNVSATLFKIFNENVRLLSSLNKHVSYSLSYQIDVRKHIASTQNARYVAISLLIQIQVPANPMKLSRSHSAADV
jgi:hypothetical protein